MFKVPHLTLLLACSVLAFSLRRGSAQSQNCDGGGGGSFVGFTALTPEQLKVTIQDSVHSSVSEVLSSLPTDEGNTSDYLLPLLDLNDTLSELVERTSKLEKTIESSVYSAVVNYVTANVEAYIKSTLSEAVVNITRVVQQLNVGNSTAPPSPPPSTSPPSTPTSPPPPAVPPPQTTCSLGSSPVLPASSCKQIYGLNSSSPSGFYWVGGGNGPPQRLYCDMERTCGGVAGGWTRVANVNMTNTSHSCPLNLVEVSSNSNRPRVCTPSSEFNIGCLSVMFSVHGVNYDHVCGRIIGYQDRTPNAFFPYFVNRSRTIDDIYLDGVSLTHGLKPRQHIWSFASALDETDTHDSGCPCLNVESTKQALVPPFVGNDYFCDTGSTSNVRNIFYPDNPLWDGKGCGDLNTCCTFNNPPWFAKTLSGSVLDDIEMRICRDAGRLNEDIPLEIIELYIR